MGKHLNPLEKELLIRQYRGDDKVRLYDFCLANNIAMNSFRTWMRQYDSGGLEALARQDKSLPDVFPEGFARKRTISACFTDNRATLLPCFVPSW